MATTFQRARVAFGPCRILFGGVDLGSTRGGTTLSYRPDALELTTDDARTAYDAVRRGEALRITTQLEMSSFRQLQAAMPAGTLVGADGDKQKLTFGGGFARMRALAKELVLHPLELADDDPSADVWVWKAVALGESKRGYKLDGESVVPVEFRGLLDTTKPQGQQLFALGLTLEYRVDVYRAGALLLDDEWADIYPVEGDADAVKIIMPVSDPLIAAGDRIDQVVATLPWLGSMAFDQAERSFDVTAATNRGTHLEIEATAI